LRPNGDRRSKLRSCPEQMERTTHPSGHCQHIDISKNLRSKYAITLSARVQDNSMYSLTHFAYLADWRDRKREHLIGAFDVLLTCRPKRPPSPTGARPFLSIRQGRSHVFLAIALALSACGGGKSGQPPMREAEEGVVTLTALPVTTTVELSGRTNATKIAEVRLQVDGFIKARLFAPDSSSIRSISVPTEPHATREPRNWQTPRPPPRGRRRRASSNIASP